MGGGVDPQSANKIKFIFSEQDVLKWKNEKLSEQQGEGMQGFSEIFH